MQAVVGALQEDQARTLRQWEGRLARVEARPVIRSGSGAESAPSMKGALEGPRAQLQVKPPRRPYPQLVTLEPEEGEEFIYGEAWRPSLIGGRHERPSSRPGAGSTSWMPASGWWSW